MVHSLGIVIDNKLAVLLDRKAEAKVDESDFAKKVRKDKVKVKKVKNQRVTTRPVQGLPWVKTGETGKE